MCALCVYSFLSGALPTLRSLLPTTWFFRGSRLLRTRAARRAVCACAAAVLPPSPFCSALPGHNIAFAARHSPFRHSCAHCAAAVRALCPLTRRCVCNAAQTPAGLRTIASISLCCSCFPSLVSAVCATAIRCLHAFADTIRACLTVARCVAARTHV